MQNSHGSRRTSLEVSERTDYGKKKETLTRRLWDYKTLPRTESDRLGNAAKWRGRPKLLAPSQAPGSHVDIVCDLATY